MKQNGFIKSHFSIPDYEQDVSFLSTGFAANDGHDMGKHHDIILVRETTLFGKTIRVDEVKTDLYDTFYGAQASTLSRSRDNDAGFGGDNHRLISGAVIAIGYGRKLNKTEIETKKALGMQNIDDVCTMGKKIKNDFEKMFGHTALNEIRQCMHILCGDHEHFLGSLSVSSDPKVD